MNRQYGNKYKAAGGTGDITGLEETSCITFIFNVLKYGYTRVGETEIVKKLGELEKNGLRLDSDKGSTDPRKKGLAAFLVDNGWKAHYWNPDVYQPRDLQGHSGEASEHTYSFQKVMGRITGEDMSYKGVFPSGLVVGYNKTTKYQNNRINSNYRDEEPENTKTFKELENEKFCVTIARGGVHTFLLSRGNVWEVHWDQYKDEMGLRRKMLVMKNEGGILRVKRYVDVKKEVLRNANAWEWQVDYAETKLYEISPFVEYEYLSGLVLTPPESTFQSRTVAILRAEAQKKDSKSWWQFWK
jgi:hypothetical protein